MFDGNTFTLCKLFAFHKEIVKCLVLEVIEVTRDTIAEWSRKARFHDTMKYTQIFACELDS